MSYSSIFWLPLCAVLTALGLVLSYHFGRRRGNRAMLRGAAWSLLPIAAYLTGSIEMFWRIGDAIGEFATAFVFSPVKWAGIAVTGAAAALFVATGGRQRRKAARLKAAARAEQKSPPAAAGASAGTAATTAISAATPGAEGRPPRDAGAATVPVARKPEPAKDAKAKRRDKGTAPVGDDMKDIEDILRKRGI